MFAESAIFIGLLLMTIYTLVELADYTAAFLREIHGAGKGKE